MMVIESLGRPLPGVGGDTVNAPQLNDRKRERRGRPCELSTHGVGPLRQPVCHKLMRVKMEFSGMDCGECDYSATRRSRFDASLILNPSDYPTGNPCVDRSMLLPAGSVPRRSAKDRFPGRE